MFEDEAGKLPIEKSPFSSKFDLQVEDVTSPSQTYQAKPRPLAEGVAYKLLTSTEKVMVSKAEYHESSVGGRRVCQAE